MNKTIIAVLIVLFVACYSFAELRRDGVDIESGEFGGSVDYTQIDMVSSNTIIIGKDDGDTAELPIATSIVIGRGTSGDIDGLNEATFKALFNLESGSDYLGLANTTAFTPDADYEPATKIYVDNRGTRLDLIGDPTANGSVDLTDKIMTFVFGSGAAWRFQGTDPGDYFQIGLDSNGMIEFKPVGGATIPIGTITVLNGLTHVKTETGVASSATIVSAEDSDTSTYSPLIMAVNGAAPYGTLGGQTNHWRFFTDGTVETVGTAMIEIPNSTSDMALTATKNLSLNYTDDQINLHMGSTGEAQGEVALSVLQHIKMSFDPKAVCDGAVDRLFIMTVGDDAPEGIHITEWKLSFEADPTTEADIDLKYADAFIGVANAAVIDVLDTTTGASTEDTDANINSGAAIANGKVLYLEFGTAYTETTHQVVFEMWYYAEED